MWSFGYLNATLSDYAWIAFGTVLFSWIWLLGKIISFYTTALGYTVLLYFSNSDWSEAFDSFWITAALTIVSVNTLVRSYRNNIHSEFYGCSTQNHFKIMYFYITQWRCNYKVFCMENSSGQRALGFLFIFLYD